MLCIFKLVVVIYEQSSRFRVATDESVWFSMLLQPVECSSNNITEFVLYVIKGFDHIMRGLNLPEDLMLTITYVVFNFFGLATNGLLD